MIGIFIVHEAPCDDDDDVDDNNDNYDDDDDADDDGEREKAVVKREMMIFTSASCLTECRRAFMIVFKPGQKNNKMPGQRIKLGQPKMKRLSIIE